MKNRYGGSTISGIITISSIINCTHMSITTNNTNSNIIFFDEIGNIFSFLRIPTPIIMIIAFITFFSTNYIFIITIEPT